MAWLKRAFTQQTLAGPALLFVLALFLVTPMAVMEDIPQRDVLNRYAPMAEAFARSEWGLAFHPRIPPLFPVSAGLLVKATGIDGYTACKAISVLCFALGVFPLFALLKRVFPPPTPLLACVAYCFCSYLLRLGMEGMRETAKCVLLLWAAYGLLVLFQQRRRLLGYLTLAAACALMIQLRDDSVLPAALLLLTAITLEIAARQWPWRSAAALLLALLVMSPTLAANYRLTGYPVPSSRFASMAANILPRYALGGKPQPRTTAAPAPRRAAASQPAITPSWGKDRALTDSFTAPALLEFATSLAKGLYFIYGIPALLIIVMRMRARTWTRGETLLLLLVAGHTLVQVAQILIFDRELYVSRRYLLPAVPLYFGWTALFVTGLHHYSAARLSPRKLQQATLSATVLMLLFLYGDAMASPIKQRLSPRAGFERRVMLDWSARIRADYRGPARSALRFDPDAYRTGFRPRVASDNLPELGYLAGGEGIEVLPRDVLRRRLKVDYIAAPLPASGKPPQYPGFELMDVAQQGGRRCGLWKSVDRSN
jgi:hypothetical protein